MYLFIYLFILGLLNNDFNSTVYIASKYCDQQRINWNGC